MGTGAELLAWCAGFLILVAAVVLFTAEFIRRDSLDYDNERLWGKRDDLKDKR
mgnify:CR=1 FL=1